MTDPAAPVPIERLLEHRVWVQALARALVLDESRADDVAQEAWLAAMRAPPRHGGAVRAWLGRLVRHRAADLRRGESRREARERVAPPERTMPGPSEVVGRIEEHGRVVRAVLALDEPYRTTVVLRFYEDLTVPQIAERMGAPVETVRTRLKRALAQLREKLDAEHGGDRRAWCLALTPLATAGATHAPQWAAGGIIVTAKTKAFLAAALVLAVLGVTTAVFVPWRGGAGGDDAGTETASGSPGAGAARRRAAGAANDDVSHAAGDVAAAPRGTASIVGWIRFGESGKAAVAQSVAVDTAGSAPVTSTTDERGGFRFEGLGAGRVWRVRVAAEGFATVVVPNVRLESDETRDVGVLVLDTPRSLAVTVKDWGDRPIAGATVEVHRERTLRGTTSDAFALVSVFRDVQQPVAAATTDADGRAAFADIPRGGWTISARAPGRVPSSSSSISTEHGSPARDVVIRLERGESLEGRLLARDQSPAAGRTICAGNLDPYLGAAFALPAVTGSDGRFVLEGLSRGDVKLHVGAPGLVPALVATVRIPAGRPVEIVLGGRTVEGRVVASADHTVVADARILATVVGDREQWVIEGRSDEHGRYRLDTLRDGNVHTFRVERTGFATLSETAAPGTSLAFIDGHATRDFVLRPAAHVSGRVVGPDGPVPAARVVATWWSDPTGMVLRETTAAPDGSFTVTGVAPGIVVLQALSGSASQTGLSDDWVGELMRKQRPAGSFDVPEGGLTEVEITMGAGRIVSGRVETAEGAPAPGASVRCHFSEASTAGDGTFRIATPVTTRQQMVSATLLEHGTAMQQIPGGGSVEGIVLRLASRPRVSGRVTGPGGGPAPEGARVGVVFLPAGRAYGNTGYVLAQAPVVDGRYETEFTVPGSADGRFSVRAEAPRFASVTSPHFMLEPGRLVYEADLAVGALRDLEGRVVSTDESASAIRGARISLVPAKAAHDRNAAPLPVAAITDAEGRFRIPEAPEGAVKVDVLCEGFVRDMFETSVPAEQFLIRLEPAREITGIVVRGDGTPLEGVSVHARRRLGNEFDFVSDRTDAAGRFRLRGLRAAAYEVGASQSWKGITSLRPWKREGVDAGTTDLRIVMESAAQISGRVVAADGTPVANCSVGVRSETGDPYTPSDITNEDGTFVVRGLGSGTYTVTARPPIPQRMPTLFTGARWLAAALSGVLPGAADVVIRLPDGETIRGSLVDASSKPMAGEWVRANAVPGESVERDYFHIGFGAQTDDAGAFTITGLQAGRYRIVHVSNPWAGGADRALRGGEVVVAGAFGVRLTVGGLGSISGVVVDEDDRPLADVRVEAGQTGARPDLSARTGVDGTFVLKELSDAARYTLSVRKPEHVPATVADVAVGATGVRLRVVRGLEAAGVVRLADGTAFANGYVRLTLDGADYSVAAPTDAEGRFTAKALKPGVYRVEEILTEIRAGGRTEPRACGRITAGERDVELRFTE